MTGNKKILLSIAFILSLIPSIAAYRVISIPNATSCSATIFCEADQTVDKGTVTTIYRGFPASYKIEGNFKPNNQSKYASVGFVSQATNPLLILANVLFWMMLLINGYFVARYLEKRQVSMKSLPRLTKTKAAHNA